MNKGTLHHCRLRFTLDDHSAPWDWPDLSGAMADEPLLYGEWLPCRLRFAIGALDLPPCYLPVLQVGMMLPTELRTLPDERSFTWPWADSGRSIRFMRHGNVVRLEGPFIPQPLDVDRDQLLTEVARVERECRELLASDSPVLFEHPHVGPWLRGADYQIPPGRLFPDPT